MASSGLRQTAQPQHSGTAGTEHAPNAAAPTKRPPPAGGPAGCEITRLVDDARRQGQPDVFQGNRQWFRYYLPTPLEIAASPDQPSTIRTAVMHNVSEGGIGFWSKDPFAPESTIYVRGWSATKATEWLMARVRHSSLGINGYLIGAAFENLPRGRLPGLGPAESQARDQSRRRNTTPARWRRGSLRTKCAAAAAVAAGIGAALGALLYQHAVSPTLSWETALSETWGSGHALMPVTAVFALLLGGLGAWICLGPPVRFVQVLCEQIRQMASGAAMVAPPRAAPCRELAGVLAALADLGARWRTREDDERTQRQKLEELNLVKTNILSMVSHDLRTPLTSIRLYSEMLSGELDTLAKNDQIHFLQVITEECKRLSRLVDDLLEAQRLEAGRVRWDMRPLDLSKLVQACALVFEPMARSKSIDLQVDCAESLPAIEADADRMSQVLSNLVSNAIKYTQTGGTVQLSARASGDEVLICVADNGPGIPRDQWDRIFDRFAQISVSFVREISGVGLGLFIVRQIVTRHGGRVWVDSEVGKGSSFYVALPRQASPDSARAEEAELPGAGRVVVCDADPELANRMAHRLKRQHYDVRTAYSGCRLLAQIVESQPDVVVTDVLLPDMNSADVLSSLNDLRERQQFKLVVHTYVADSLELRRRRVDVVLGRPARPEELVQAVEVALKKKTPSGLAVLLFCDARVDVPGLCHLCLESGHIPLTAGSRAQAARIARDYPIDAVLASEEVLDSEWSALSDILPPGQWQPRVIVLVERVGRSQRRAAAERGITLAVYERGREADLIADVVAKPQTGAEEGTP